MRSLYNGIVLEQDLMLNRRRRDNEIQYSKVADMLFFPDPSEAASTAGSSSDYNTYAEAEPEAPTTTDQPPMIYACATMWHENKQEMTQLMKSLLRYCIKTSKLYERLSVHLAQIILIAKGTEIYDN